MKLFHAGGFRFFDENYILLDLLGFGSVQNWNNSGDMYNTDALRTLLFVDSLQFLFSAFWLFELDAFTAALTVTKFNNSECFVNICWITSSSRFFF